MNLGVVAPAAQTASPTSNLGLQEFMKILLTQLTYQDPLKPMNNQEFIAQVAQFTTLEQTQQLNSKTDQLVMNQAALQSVGLIGKTVDIVVDDVLRTGTVSALSLGGASPTLTLALSSGGTVPGVSLSQIVNVR